MDDTEFQSFLGKFGEQSAYGMLQAILYALHTGLVRKGVLTQDEVERGVQEWIDKFGKKP